MIEVAEPLVGRRERERVRDVLEGGMLADGQEVREFETEFAAHCDVAHGVATSNGTTALHTALHALGLGAGDRVLTTPFSFVASANAIRFCGAEPVFADIDPDTYNLDPDAVERVVEREPVDAILAVHLYGQPAPLDPLVRIAEEHDLLLVEDAAQAHGATYDGHPVGSFGDAACFSFYPTKNMTTGEGGMVVTDRRDVAERAARFVNHGRSDAYLHEELGHNFRLTNVAAAMGRVQLERLPEFLIARRDNARRLKAALEDSPVVAPHEPAHVRHAYNQFTVRAEDRDGLAEHLTEAGVRTAEYYPRAIHEQPVYSDVDHHAPVAERAAEEVLSVPVHPGLSSTDLETVATALEAYDA